MKKIILCILLIGVLLLLTSCDDMISDLSEVGTEKYATIFMPDGSSISGKCTNFYRYNDHWVYLKIDGITYYTDTWRVILQEK